jgi:hypothetical protein
MGHDLAGGGAQSEYARAGTRKACETAAAMERIARTCPFGRGLADLDLADDARRLADDRLFGHLADLERAFLEVRQIGLGGRTVDGAPLHARMLLAQCDQLLGRRLDDAAEDADAAARDRALADRELLLDFLELARLAVPSVPPVSDVARMVPPSALSREVGMSRVARVSTSRSPAMAVAAPPLQPSSRHDCAFSSMSTAPHSLRMRSARSISSSDDGVTVIGQRRCVGRCGSFRLEIRCLKPALRVDPPDC